MLLLLLMRRKIHAVLILLLITALVTQAIPVRPARAQETFDPDEAERATVYVMQTYLNPAGQTVIACVGSGTLVSADGLILTNAHLTMPSASCRTDQIVIGLTVKPGEPPVPKYYASQVEVNLGWDLALLQITATIDRLPVNRATLSLPFVELGDSESLHLDDTINVVGYVTPDDKSNGAAQAVRGTVKGFTAESRIGDRAWIKASAIVPGDMSGGGAYNTQGQLIGIPTIEPARSGGAPINCRYIQDTNADGRVDELDGCIPVSGFINALRPARLARGLVLAARLGIEPATPSPAQPEARPTDQPTFSRLFFAEGVNQAEMPTTVVTGVPAGITRLYLFFDYSNMVDGMIYELRTTQDGIPNPTFSLAPATWSGGRQGLWYIGSTAQVWPNGTYEFTLFIEGARVASKQITVGGVAQLHPMFSDILFGIVDQNQLVNTGNVLPVGNTINAQFVYNNMPPDTVWRQRWYYQGLKIAENAGTWADKDPSLAGNGKRSISAGGPSGAMLQPGRYRLELTIGPDDELAATADFVMAGALSALRTDIFSNLSFATEWQGDHPGGTTGTTFGSTVQHLYATFNWREIAPGTPWAWRWTVDNNPLFEVAQPWTASDNPMSWLRLDTQGHLPDGSYKLELLVAGVVMVSATAKVGLGQLPSTIFGAAQGVQVQGRILDAETGKGIAGVSFIVLKTDFAVRDFTWNMSEALDISLTDSQGNFVLDRLLPRGQSYSVIVIANGYLPVSTDSLKIDDKTKSPLVLTIELNRD